MPNIFPASVDAVAVFDTNFNQLFQNARPIKASVRQNARAMEHPLESGQIITDYRVILPIEIEMSVIVMNQFYQSTYQEILNAFLNSTLLTVQTKTATYQNMIIAEMPHEESPELFDALPMGLRFKQVRVVTQDSTFAPADQTQTTTQTLGEQNPTPFTSALPPGTPATFTYGGAANFGG